jgi:hypothetical protein
VDNKEKEIQGRDIVKGISAFATGWVVQGKALGSLSKLLNTVHTRAITFVQNDSSVLLKQFLNTADGQLLKVLDHLKEIAHNPTESLETLIAKAYAKVARKNPELVAEIAGTNLKQPVQPLLHASSNMQNTGGSNFIKKIKNIAAEQKKPRIVEKFANMYEVFTKASIGKKTQRGCRRYSFCLRWFKNIQSN